MQKIICIMNNNIYKIFLIEKIFELIIIDINNLIGSKKESYMEVNSSYGYSIKIGTK